MVQFTRAELRLAVVCVAASVALAFSGVVLAAEAAAEDADELEEVQITGTRIQTPGVTSANPVDSITGEQMRQLGIVNVADALLQLVPQNVSTYSPFVSGDDQFETNGFAVAGGGLDRSSYFLGNTIANLRGLDPTFGTRTLTMVDGRRVVSTSNQADVVDLNIIPSNLLQRMDVVTGGASATYGSGAMAGVVNLVLNNRLTGFNLDMDYGINEAGDGSSPHISASGGMPLFGGKGHMLVGAEWQDQASIRNCAEARDWCRESRFMFTNGAGNNVTQPIGALPGFEEGYPGRFEMNNVRYSQFAPGSTIYHNSVNNPVGYRFELNPDTNLVGVEEYAYGFRGGAGTANVMNGDGPLVTSGQNLRTGNNRKTLFGNFEYNFTERTTAYLQTNFAKTHATNKNAYTRGDYCVRFDQLGSTGQNADLGAVWVYSTPNAMHYVVDNQPYVGLTRTSQLNTINASVQAFLGLVSTVNTYPSGPTGGILRPDGQIVASGVSGSAARGVAAPFWIPYRDAPNGPNFTFAGNATGKWVRVAFNTWDPAGTLYNPNYPENDFWLLESVTLTTPYDVVGGATILPSRGRNEYAFLNTLEPEALDRLQRSFVTGTTGAATVGAGAGVDTVYGTTPCSGFTAVRKVWNPQFDRWTEQSSETMRIVGGVKGRFGRDWRWDAYYQWGKTESTSSQNNVDTRLRVAFAMDAVIDDRLNIDGVANPNFGKPVCRITRDGVPVLDSNGRPLSDPEGLQALAAGCQPLNVFGTSFQTADAAALQQAALDYAFVESISSGSTSLQTLSFTTNGTLWQGWGAGPMTGAFGLEMRKNGVDNPSTTGDFWARSDLQSVWQDGFAGSTTTTEGSVEINLPLVSGVPGVNLWSINSAVRYTSDKNKGGAGTTGQTTTKDTLNWKFQTVFEPFDWMRLRLSRSRDLRAPGYRDLFTFQPGIPDQLQGNNPWRERTAASTENQVERWGQVAVGNINLKPETSNTLTLGLVLSPSGWAQGMRFTADYFNIQVRDGIAVPFSGGTPMTACWEGSGNLPEQYVDGGIALDENGNPFGRNGQFDYDYQAPDGGFPCQELSFAETTADDPDAIQIPNRPGYYTLQDIVSYNSRRPQNSLPYQRRGIDFSLSYMFPLSRAFEELPGNLSLTIRATRALEASGIQLLTGSAIQPVTGIGGATNTAAGCQPPNRWEPATNSCYVSVDLTGQIRSGTFVPGVAASPLWTGNIVATYLVGDLTASLSARYIGGARLDKTWCDAEQSAQGFCNTYQNAQGQFLNGSVDSNWVKPYLNYSLNGSYNLKVSDMKQFQVFGSINNLLDKSPPYTGGGISGASAQYHDTMGRAYRMGVRLKF